MYIHLHSHVLGNMLLFFFIKVFFWVDAWFSGGFHSLFSVQHRQQTAKQYAHFKRIKNAYECQQRRQTVR